MDEQAAHGGGQGFAADAAGLLEVDGGEGADTADGVIDSHAKFGKKCSVRDVGVQFCFERGELGRTELFAFGIGEQAVETARNVAQVKGDRADAGGAGVEGFVAEGRAPLLNVLTGELEGVHNGTQDSRGFGVGSAEPGFHQGTGYSSQVTGVLSTGHRAPSTRLWAPSTRHPTDAEETSQGMRTSEGR
jgi:hypothetical protein